MRGSKGEPVERRLCDVVPEVPRVAPLVLERDGDHEARAVGRAHQERRREARRQQGRPHARPHGGVPHRQGLLPEGPRVDAELVAAPDGVHQDVQATGLQLDAPHERADVLDARVVRLDGVAAPARPAHLLGGLVDRARCPVPASAADRAAGDVDRGSGGAQRASDAAPDAAAGAGDEGDRRGEIGRRRGGHGAESRTESPSFRIAVRSVPAGRPRPVRQTRETGPRRPPPGRARWRRRGPASPPAWRRSRPHRPPGTARGRPPSRSPSAR